MPTQKLTYKNPFLQDTIVKKGIVEILTTDWVKTSIWFPKQGSKETSDLELIGINHVCKGAPVKLGFYQLNERGLWNPEQKDRYYLINESEKKILVVPSKDFNLFYSKEIISETGIQYIWNSSFKDILNEFKQENYSFEEKMKGE